MNPSDSDSTRPASDQATPSAPPRGELLLKTVVNQILSNPKCWNQQSWHCGTTHCAGGWIQIKGGRPEKDTAVITDVRDLLGISYGDASWLCAGRRTLYEIHYFAANFNRAGYNRAGYNRDGYNRDGYDLAGYDLAGYDLAGFNRDGYDCAGFNRDGYDLAGFNRDGYDCAGFNRDGYDCAGKQLKPFAI